MTGPTSPTDSDATQSDTQSDTQAGGATDNAAAPEFAELEESRATKSSAGFQLDRFAGVQVVLTVELGRAQLTLQELMDLSEGAVVELNRNISAPVELVAQGVPLGNGEVVVVEDQFAVRIKELYQNPKI